MPDKDAERVRGTLAGDVSAFAELYDRYAPLVRAICHGTTGDGAPAEDLCQDVFLRAYSKLASLRRPERFAGWLVGIARRVCRQWRRQRLRDRQHYAGRDPTVAAAADPPEDDAAIQTLHEAIGLLPEKERLALHVFYLQDETVDRVRVVLGLSRSGAYQVLKRARERLERLMRRLGEEVS